MELPKFDSSQYSYPLKTLLMGNEDTWSAMGAVAYYHVSEVCFLRGLGGFPTSALG